MGSGQFPGPGHSDLTAGITRCRWRRRPVSLLFMEVTFTKLPGRRYLMTVDREIGPQLAPRTGPGYHDYLPHDVGHFLAEAEAGLAGGVFGRIAAGHSNLFWPADPALLRRQGRRERKWRPSPAERADMDRSEALASLGEVLWEWRAGHRQRLPQWVTNLSPTEMGSPLMRRLLARLSDFAAQWHALPDHGSITLPWPVPIRRNHGRPGRPV
jgi:hypothetical protein